VRGKEESGQMSNHEEHIKASPLILDDDDDDDEMMCWLSFHAIVVL
jgi:hypothetical protein